MTDQYAVMGNPVAHSKSPAIHAAFAAQTGQPIAYERILVEPGGFTQAVAGFRAAGGRGLNVTVPFKHEAFALADVPGDRATLAGAANTLWFEGGTVHADNTDGVGLVRDITENHGRALAGRRVLVLGAGGAVAGILGPLLEQTPESLMIVNRTVSKAMDLAQRFSGRGVEVGACGYEALAGRTFDLLINATAASLGGELPPLPEGIMAEGAWCYDLMYADQPTPFMRWAAERGVDAVDGLGMLVEQAAESFYIWRGVRPETAPVIASMREKTQPRQA